MTGTDLREALHAVAEDTRAPAPDRVVFHRLVRRERRTRLAGRVAVAGAAAAVVAVGASAVAQLPRNAPESPPTVTPVVPGPADLEAPVYLVADGQLAAVDPQGGYHSLDLDVEEVVGWTPESVYAVDQESRVVRLDLDNSDEGPGGPWTWESAAVEVPGPVQSARLSADGRWLGWVDLAERLHVLDLKAGAAADPVRLEGSGYLVDIAQGTGDPLVSDDAGLLLRTGDGVVAVPTRGAGPAWAATVRRDLVAVADQDATTRLYDVSSGTAELVDSVPGTAWLSPYGQHLVSVSRNGADDGAEAWVWTTDGEPARLGVPGVPRAAGWADDDTVLVTTVVGAETTLVACDVADAGPCSVLPIEGVTDIRLAR